MDQDKGNTTGTDVTAADVNARCEDYKLNFSEYSLKNPLTIGTFCEPTQLYTLRIQAVLCG